MYFEKKKREANVPDFDILDWPERLYNMLSGDAHKAEA